MKKLLALALSTALTVAGIALMPTGGASNSFAAAQREAGRIAPPTALTCDRDRLTSFTGAVTRYSRTPGLITLRVRTDEATTENFKLRLPRRGGASKHLLLNGEPFAEDDWKKIESKVGRLRPRMRATVWVCADEAAPFVDWRPGERPAGVY